MRKEGYYRVIIQGNKSYSIAYWDTTMEWWYSHHLKHNGDDSDFSFIDTDQIPVEPQRVGYDIVADLRNKLGSFWNLSTMVHKELLPSCPIEALIKMEAETAESTKPLIEEIMLKLRPERQVDMPSVVDVYTKIEDIFDNTLIGDDWKVIAAEYVMSILKSRTVGVSDKDIGEKAAQAFPINEGNALFGSQHKMVSLGNQQSYIKGYKQSTKDRAGFSESDFEKCWNAAKYEGKSFADFLATLKDKK